ncbi:predicted protein [Naegleria gruberi]|uniref:Predicted protein n=1 Tax=Naegleria gruberi TaxID=5762 RepID=D2W1W3_NAEGR|nr:uncharacterized protein NAEGRDRAFT_54007 [Naegleria gruberi]EFC36988.1 predicted protein [Naegleria gruberi]|eukprot:XP_002669732.1 predicted protein [Naegleria gruberi strain NEG-M]
MQNNNNNFFDQNTNQEDISFNNIDSIPSENNHNSQQGVPDELFQQILATVANQNNMTTTQPDQVTLFTLQQSLIHQQTEQAEQYFISSSINNNTSTSTNLEESVRGNNRMLLPDISENNPNFIEELRQLLEVNTNINNNTNLNDNVLLSDLGNDSTCDDAVNQILHQASTSTSNINNLIIERNIDMYNHHPHPPLPPLPQSYLTQNPSTCPIATQPIPTGYGYTNFPPPPLSYYPQPPPPQSTQPNNSAIVSPSSQPTSPTMHASSQVMSSSAVNNNILPPYPPHHHYSNNYNTHQYPPYYHHHGYPNYPPPHPQHYPPYYHSIPSSPPYPINNSYHQNNSNLVNHHHDINNVSTSSDGSDKAKTNGFVIDENYQQLPKPSTTTAGITISPINVVSNNNNITPISTPISTPTTTTPMTTTNTTTYSTTNTSNSNNDTCQTNSPTILQFLQERGQVSCTLDARQSPPPAIPQTATVIPQISNTTPISTPSSSQPSIQPSNIVTVKSEKRSKSSSSRKSNSTGSTPTTPIHFPVLSTNNTNMGFSSPSTPSGSPLVSSTSVSSKKRKQSDAFQSNSSSGSPTNIRKIEFTQETNFGKNQSKKQDDFKIISYNTSNKMTNVKQLEKAQILLEEAPNSSEYLTIQNVADGIVYDKYVEAIKVDLIIPEFESSPKLSPNSKDQEVYTLKFDLIKLKKGQEKLQYLKNLKKVQVKNEYKQRIIEEVWLGFSSQKEGKFKIRTTLCRGTQEISVIDSNFFTTISGNGLNKRLAKKQENKE